MKNFVRIILLSFAIVSLVACGSLMKNSEATKLAAQRTKGHQYSQSLDDLEKTINNQLMTMQMVTGGMDKAKDMEIKTPLETNINLRRLRYKGKMKKISKTRVVNRAYNLLEKSPRRIRFIGKRMTRPHDETYALYTIHDRGGFRTVKVETIEKMVVTHKSKNSVNVSIMGIGVNYKDFYDLDESLKKAYVDETEQWAVLQRVDSQSAKKMYEEARQSVEGKEYESRVQ